MRTMAVAALVAGISLAASGAALAQGTRQTGQAQQPKYACSVTVPQGADRHLAGLAKITLAQATKSAEAAVPGRALSSSLSNENGCLVYSSEIQSASGQVHDVRVDAGTGTVVYQSINAHQGPDNEGAGEGENSAEDGR